MKILLQFVVAENIQVALAFGCGTSVSAQLQVLCTLSSPEAYLIWYAGPTWTMLMAHLRVACIGINMSGLGQVVVLWNWTLNMKLHTYIVTCDKHWYQWFSVPIIQVFSRCCYRRSQMFLFDIHIDKQLWTCGTSIFARLPCFIYISIQNLMAIIAASSRFAS